MPSAGQTGPSRRTRLTAPQRRESILKAATEVFAEVGYRAGKVSDVAGRVGVTEPVIFQNFGSKAALFAAVLDRVASDLDAELHASPGHDGPAAGLLAHILSPSQAGKPHGPGPHRALFADAASLLADPGAGEAASRVAGVIAGHLACRSGAVRLTGTSGTTPTPKRRRGCCCRSCPRGRFARPGCPAPPILNPA